MTTLAEQLVIQWPRVVVVMNYEAFALLQRIEMFENCGMFQPRFNLRNIQYCYFNHDQFVYLLNSYEYRMFLSFIYLPCYFLTLHWHFSNMSFIGIDRTSVV